MHKVREFGLFDDKFLLERPSRKNIPLLKYPTAENIQFGVLTVDVSNLNVPVR